VTVWHLVIREIAHRKGRFALGLLSVAVAVGSLVGAIALMDSYGLRTREILDRKEAALDNRLGVLGDAMRKAMLGLGFNIIILPRDQNLGDFYASDYAAKDMPEEYVTVLATSRLVTIRHLLPSLQQKIEWPEVKRSVLLMGTRGEESAAAGEREKPMAQPVPPGTLVLGSELHQNLGLHTGDTVRLLGRAFTVAQCHAPRGSKDDITVWMNLAEAQELLGKKGRINAILAVECQCAWADLGKVRREIEGVLPDTQVVERSSEALARAEARLKVEAEGKAALQAERDSRLRLGRERERMAATLVPLVLLACAMWIGFLTLGDVRARRSEIGILRALGAGGRQILALFLVKAVLLGILGGAAGLLAGLVCGPALGVLLDGASLSSFALPPLRLAGSLAPVLLVAPAMTVLCSWIPAVIAARQDPADILREA
jgi:ABC-type lipoprotein release transport system permease subunit